MWEAGYTARAIADGLGLANVDHVYSTIRREAPELRRQKERRARGQSTLQQVAALRRQRRSNREIAHELGITRGLLEHHVRRGLASGAIARRQRIVSATEAHEIIALNTVGSISCREIACRFGVHVQTVYRVLRIACVAPSTITRRQQLKPKILALWQTGGNSEAIAHLYGVTADYVRGVARRAAMKNPAFRRQGPRLTAAEINRIAALRRESTYSCAEIAEIIDVHYSSVQRAIRKLAQSEPGLALDRGLIAKNRLPEVMLLMAQGLRPAIIAERFGVGREAMYKLLYRLRRRAKGRGGRL
jgi:transposase